VAFEALGKDRYRWYIIVFGGPSLWFSPNSEIIFRYRLRNPMYWTRKSLCTNHIFHTNWDDEHLTYNLNVSSEKLFLVSNIIKLN